MQAEFGRKRGQAEAALAKHHDQPYTRSVFERYEAWLAEPLEVRRMSAPQ